jgi:hypothetical protein
MPSQIDASGLAAFSAGKRRLRQQERGSPERSILRLPDRSSIDSVRTRRGGSAQTQPRKRARPRWGAEANRGATQHAVEGVLPVAGTLTPHRRRSSLTSRTR